MWKLLEKWLKALWLKTRSAAFAADKKPIPIRLQCEELYEKLATRELMNYDPVRAQGFHISTFKLDISQFIDLVKAINSTLRKGAVVSSTTCPWQLEMVTLDSLFVHAAEHYYIPITRVQELQKEVLDFLTLMAASDDVEYGTWEHNRRVLGNLLGSLLNIGQALNDALE
jgi:hypothetical protein